MKLVVVITNYYLNNFMQTVSVSELAILSHLQKLERRRQ